LVIDEAGMIGSRQLGRVLKAAEQAEAKVVLLGDDKQLAAIEAGAAFKGVVQHVGAAEITEVRRQKEAWAREAGQQFARGSVADGLAAYAERGHVKIHDSRDAARDALAAAYVGDQAKGSQIILAHSNKDVQALNEAVREARKERGELRGTARFVAERGGREFAPGDRIVFLKNDRDLGVKNGTLGTVERAEDGSLAVRLDSGEARQVQASQYAAVDHGYAVTIHKAQGVTVDRAYMLATPGMDRSLAYVGMTRHREAATLFAGADDFTDKRAGRLVDFGAAPYENNPESRPSYFATLENDKGEQHTIWGVDLERAIAASGAKRGERIGLEHGGSETVRLPDGN
ncbi:AAA family ATPase, partial [Xanthomonas hortorum]